MAFLTLKIRLFIEESDIEMSSHAQVGVVVHNKPGETEILRWDVLD
jgi:hypothetical protein